MQHQKPERFHPAAGWDEAKTKTIITEGREKGSSWNDIERKLNKEGLTTKLGKKWATGNACNVALTKGWVTRVHNTTVGAIGSTGKPTAPAPTGYHHLNGLAKPKRKTKKEREGVSDREIEDIMTSSLDTGLKMKVIRLLAMHR